MDFAKTKRFVVSKLVSNFNGNNLKARCMRSTVFLGSGVFIAKSLGFVSKVILARLIVPQDIGLMVMIFSITGLFEVLTEVGIKQSVIQQENGDDPEYLNTAWWLQVLRATGLYLISFIAAPWLCEFYFHTKTEVLTRYSLDELITLVRVAFLSILFNGLISPESFILEKRFKFGRAVLITQGGAVLGAVVTIILAFIIRNVWAIVIGFVIIGLARCLMSYALCPFLPKFAYHRESFRVLSHYASGMFGLPVLTYIAFNIDVLVAGKLVPTSMVGYYGMALMLAFTPWYLFSGTIAPVLLPAFAEKQNDKKALSKAVLQITQYVALFTFPPAVLAMVCSKSILTIVYEPQYAAVAFSFCFFCIYILFLIQESVLASLFLGIGQPGKLRTVSCFRAVILIVLIYPGIKLFGLTGAAFVVTISNLAALYLQIIIASRMIELRIFDYARSWLVGLFAAISVLVITLPINGFKSDYTVVHLMVGVSLCVIFCLTGLFLLRYHKKSGHSSLQKGLSVVFTNKEDAQRV